ncbi:hypothetical protein [Oricola sp.]|nr:hypothetical protein [Oricola sp.]
MTHFTLERRALAAAFILQDRKRLPVRFFGAFCGAMLSRRG